MHWEYLVVVKSDYDNDGPLCDFNGTDWELIAVVPLSSKDAYRCFFKRPKPPNDLHLPFRYRGVSYVTVNNICEPTPRPR